MTEGSVIAAAITAIAAHNLKDLTVVNTYVAALVALGVLLAAYTDTDIDNDDEAGVTAVLKLYNAALIVLVAKLVADHKVMYRNSV